MRSSGDSASSIACTVSWNGAIAVAMARGSAWYGQRISTTRGLVGPEQPSWWYSSLWLSRPRLERPRTGAWVRSSPPTCRHTTSPAASISAKNASRCGSVRSTSST
ncbi:MAG: hypothetical protein IPH80_11530 [Myxococcales bacterium]|nr:hypothetical protein [Myxococcales bacterium]